MAKFYITSAIPYVNAQPHIGHALEFVQGMLSHATIKYSETMCSIFADPMKTQ